MSVLNNYKNTILTLLPLAVACLLSVPAHAVNCGDLVSGTVTLTADLTCAGPALVVSASNTLIDLNGHTITCAGVPGGYLGSCQNVQPNIVGINSKNHSNVTVRGPGTITGFGVGVHIDGGTNNRVLGATITGPAEVLSTDLHSHRLLSVGVVISNVACGFSALAVAPSAVVQYNDISNQSMGVQLSGANCTQVLSNNIHDNEGSLGDSHGIDVIGSSNNFIANNLVTRNGLNLGVSAGVDGGIMLRGAATASNQVYQNYVTSNCGDGITTDNQAHGNNIVSNVALNNSTSTLNGRCLAAAPGTFYDVATRNQASGNQWNANNTCKTQGPGIPAGVCP